MGKLKTLNEVLAEMEPERRKRVLEEAKRIAREYDALKALRRARSKTQVQVAKELAVTQPYVAKLERKSDLMLSVLRKYVRSVGGELELSVVFPDTGRLVLSGLGAIEEGDARKPAKRVKPRVRPIRRAKPASSRPAA
jgi:transcriptional regulator with XRE-family HTH domain